MHPAKRLKHALRSVHRYANWPRIVADLLADRTPQHLHLRSGLRIDTPHNCTSLSLAQEIFFRHLYAPAGWDIRSGDTVVDIGANIGMFTLYASRRGAAQVHAFEPFPDNCAFIRRNAEQNQAVAVQVHQVAVADHSDGVRLFLSHISGGHRLSAASPRGRLTESIDVPSTTLPAIFEQCGGTIDFLKLDCEGAEGHILRATPTETLRRIPCIVMEFHDESSILSHREIRLLLEAADFAVTTRWNGRSPYGYLYARRAPPSAG